EFDVFGVEDDEALHETVVIDGGDLEHWRVELLGPAVPSDVPARHQSDPIAPQHHWRAENLGDADVGDAPIEVDKRARASMALDRDATAAFAERVVADERTERIPLPSGEALAHVCPRPRG